jgi:hypothetical protein
MVKTVGAELSASGAPGHPSSEPRGGEGGNIRPEGGDIRVRVATSESGWQHPRWQHPSSEFRVKKERKKDRGWQHPSSEFRVPSSE